MGFGGEKKVGESPFANVNVLNVWNRMLSSSIPASLLEQKRLYRNGARSRNSTKSKTMASHLLQRFLMLILSLIASMGSTQRALLLPWLLTQKIL